MENDSIGTKSPTQSFFSFKFHTHHMKSLESNTSQLSRRCSPKKQLYRAWEVFFVLMAFVNVEFELIMNLYTPDLLPYPGYVFDVIFVFNMFLTFFVPFYNENGILVSNQKSIVIHYLKGHFLWDVVTVFPCDLIYLWVKWNERHTSAFYIASPLLRINRILRYEKVYSFFRSRQEELGTHHYLNKILQYGGLVSFIGSSLACALYKIACDTNPFLHIAECDANSWINHTAVKDRYLFNNTGSSNIILEISYVTITIMTSTGFGDYAARTIPELWLLVFCMLVGVALLSGTIFSGITSIFTNLDTQRALFTHRYYVIIGEMADTECEADLQSKVLGYYEYLWIIRKGMKVSGIYNHLPLSFQAGLANCTYQHIFKKTKVFDQLEPTFLRTLTLALTPRLYLPQQMIMNRGMISQDMFFIRHGTVEILSDEDDDTTVVHLKSDRVFGELDLFYSSPKTASVRAGTHCDLIVLSRKAFYDVLKQYPSFRNVLYKKASKMCENIEELLAKEKNTEGVVQINMQDSVEIQPPQTDGLRMAFQRNSDIQSDDLQQIRRQSLLQQPHYVPPNAERKGSLELRRSILYGQNVKPDDTDVQQSENVEYSAPTRVKFAEDEKSKRVSIVDDAIYGGRSHSGKSFSLHRVSKKMSSTRRKTQVEEMLHIRKQEAQQKEDNLVSEESQSKFMEIFNYLVISPYGELRKTWARFISLVALFASFWFPLVAAFLLNQTGFSTEGEINWLFVTLAYLVDIAYAIDICVNLRTAVSTTYGLKYNFTAIVKQYVRSPLFLVDVCSVFPVSLLILGEYDARDRWVLYCMLKLSRCLKFFRIVFEFNREEALFELAAQWQRSLKRTMFVIMGIHWASCFLYMITCFKDMCPSESWAMDLEGFHIDYGSDNNTVSTTTHNLIYRYGYSLYFASSIMTTTGYGDIFAYNKNDYIAALFLMIFGFILFTYCMALTAATLANEEAPKVLFQERTRVMREFLKRHFLKEGLFNRVINYMSIMWDRYHGEWMPGGELFLNEVPKTLLQDILVQDIFWILANVPMFRDLDDSFLRELAPLLVPYLYSPGDYIIKEEELGKEFYFIKRGVCEYVIGPKATVLEEIGPGAWFGDFAAIYSDHHIATVRAKSHVIVLELQMAKLEQLFVSFPLIGEQFDSLLLNEHKYKKAQMRLKMKIKKLLNEEDEDVKLPSRGPRKTEFVSFRREETYVEIEEEVEEKCGRWSIFSWCICPFSVQPNSSLQKVWVFSRVLATMLAILLLPIHIAFLHGSIVLWGLMYTLDLMGLFLIYTGLYMGFFNEEGIAVTNPVDTAFAYLSTTFIPDVLSLLPFEVIVFVYYGDISNDTLHIAAIARFNRLLQYYRLSNFFFYIEGQILSTAKWRRYLRHAFQVVALWVWATCMFFFVDCPPIVFIDALYEGDTFTPNEPIHKCISKSWLGETFRNGTILKNFALSLYFSTMTIATVGYGDLSAKNVLEVYLTSIAMVVGAVYINYVIASITASFANANSLRARFQERLSVLKKYMVDNNINDALQKRVTSSFHLLWSKNKGLDPTQLLSGLPTALFLDVTYSMYKDILKKIPSFKGAPRPFIKALAQHIIPTLFSSGDYIFRRGDIGREVYFINQGVVEVVSDNGNVVFGELGAGETFGEEGWILKTPRGANLRAKTNCDIVILTRKALDFVLDSYPEIKTETEEMIMERRMNAAGIVRYKDDGDAKVTNEDKIKDLMSFRFLDPETRLHVIEKSFCFMNFEELRKVTANERIDSRHLRVAPTDEKARHLRTVSFLRDDDTMDPEEEALMASHARKSTASLRRRTSAKPQPESVFSPIVASVLLPTSIKVLLSRNMPQGNTEPAPEASQHRETEQVDDGTDCNDSNPSVEAVSVGEVSIPDEAMHDSASKERSKTRSNKKKITAAYLKMKSQAVLSYDASTGTDVDGILTRLHPVKITDKKDPDAEKDDVSNDVERMMNKVEADSLDSEASSGADLFDTEGSPIDINILGDDNSNCDDIDSASFRTVSTRQDAVSHSDESHVSSVSSFAEHLRDIRAGMIVRLLKKTIGPRNPALKNYQRLMIVLKLVSIWLLIFNAAFRDYSQWLYIVLYIIDVFHWVEFYIKFHTGYLTNRGNVETVYRKVAIHYFGNKPNLIVDLCAFVPLELLAVFAVNNRLHVGSFIMLLRLTRYFQIMRYMRIWEGYLEAEIFILNISMLVIQFVLSVHLLASMWFALADLFESDESWILAHNLENASELMQYSYSLYWCIACWTSTGFGDIAAVTYLEVYYCILVIILGKMFFALLIARLASNIQSAESSKVQYENKINGIQTYMKQEGVPVADQHKIIQYMEYQWRRYRGLTPHVLMKDAPTSLKCELFHEVVKPMFRNVPCLECTSNSFQRDISQYIHELVFLPDNIVTHAGDIEEELYYISKGEVEVYDDFGTMIARLFPGQYFGELSLFYRTRRKVTVKARTYVDIYSLSRENFARVLKHYPKLKQLIHSQIKVRFGYIDKNV